MPMLRTWPGPVAAVVLAVLTGVAAAPHAFAGIDEVDQKLESVERALEQERAQGERLESSAAALAREVAGLRADLIEAAHASQNYEEHVTALEVRLAGLAREEADKRAVDSLEVVHARQLKAARYLQSKAVEAMKNLPAERAVKAASALNIGWKHELLLLGEPTERQANVEEIIRRETRELLKVVNDDDEHTATG